MRIVFLNTMYGQLREPLSAFISSQAAATDIFCFQEADKSARDLFGPILTDFTEISVDKLTSVHSEQYHQVIYIKNGIEIIRSGHLLKDDLDCGLASFIELKIDGTKLSLCNVHGRVYHPKTGLDEKLDTKERLSLSRKVLEHYENATGPVIIGGDFNMLPQATSVRMFADAGYQDLITKFKIETTRNHLIWDKYPEHKQYHADYVFVSPGIGIDSFKVMPDIVSDHLPLILSVDLPTVSSELLTANASSRT